MSYNPFEKAVGDPLDLSDLQSLVGRVAEGYYVEYKSTFPSSDKVGHSVASFANTNGGWYFVGIVADNQTNVAESVPGVDLTQFPDPIAKVRDIARDHIAPMPPLFPQLVRIDTAHAVVAVYVGEGDDTPYVTRDGRIYRRNADKSDPTYETDRVVLDRLVERGKEAIQRFDRFCQDERTYCEAEARDSWAEVYLSPVPKGSVYRPDILRSQYLDELLSAAREPIEVSLSEQAKATASGSFNHAQTCSGSVILRRVEASYVAYNSLELELFTNGRARMFLPLRRQSLPFSKELVQSGRSATVLGRLLESDASAELGLLNLVDLVETSHLLGYLVVFYLKWLHGLGWTGDLLAKVRLSNVWRAVPFFDTDDWGKFVEKFGLPVCSRSSIMMPPEGSKPLLVQCSEETGAPVIELFGMFAVALGLPSDLVSRLLAAAWSSARQAPS